MRHAALVVVLLAGCGGPAAPPGGGAGDVTGVPPASHSSRDPRHQPGGGAGDATGAPPVRPAQSLVPLGERPTCALIDPDKDPRVALVEAQLLADSTTTWVERGDIEAVLREQKLQALFTPQGVGERVRLGKLLKADLLILVRTVKVADGHALEAVVSETAGGLRLAVRGIAVTSNSNADAATLAAAVRDGIARSHQPITGVVAVPPFVGHDLGHELDHCKTTYSRLAESTALSRPGVVAVELAEADALGKELALGAAAGRSSARCRFICSASTDTRGRGTPGR
ncbi:hypothetical protein J0H58_22170 [bacterium]|nr:hypothetical protein [bacterium]